MFFNSKTNEITGKLGKITAEEREFLKKQIDAGIMVSTEHPSQEYTDALAKQQSEHGIGWGLKQMFLESQRKE